MRLALVTAALVAGLGGPASAQVVRGSVVAGAGSAPIEDARVALYDEAGRERGAALTDAAGQFAVRLRQSGRYLLRVEHLGFAPASLADLDVGAGEDVAVEVVLAAEAIGLAPVTVIGRRTFEHTRLQGYYERLEWNGRLGVGRFVTREEIERYPGHDVRTLVRMAMPNVRTPNNRPGEQLVFRLHGVDCYPQWYLDGIRTTQAQVMTITSDLIEGVEIYRGPSQMQAEYWDRGNCGVILVWTERGMGAGGKRLTWRRLLLAGAVVGAIVLSGSVGG